MMRARREAVSENASRSIRGLPRIPVPPRPDPFLRACAYEQDGTYLGFLRDGDDAPAGSVVKMQPCSW